MAKKNITDLQSILKVEHDVDAEVEDIYKLLTKDLAKVGIIESDIEVSKTNPLDYLTIRLQILNEKKHIKINKIGIC